MTLAQEAAGPLDRDQHARSERVPRPTRSSTARSTSPGGCGSRRSGRTCRTSATTPSPREPRTSTPIYCDGPEAAADGMARYGATYVLSSGGVLDCDGLDRPTSTSSAAIRSPSSTGRRRDLASGGLRTARASDDQPFGSTMIVTSGVMPAQTLIATLYVPSDLSGSSRSILWRSISMPAAGRARRRCPSR